MGKGVAGGSSSLASPAPAGPLAAGGAQGVPAADRPWEAPGSLRACGVGGSGGSRGPAGGYMPRGRSVSSVQWDSPEQ